MPWFVEDAFPQLGDSFPGLDSLAVNCPYCQNVLTTQHNSQGTAVSTTTNANFVSLKDLSIRSDQSLAQAFNSILSERHPIGMFAYTLLCKRCGGLSFLLVLTKMVSDTKGKVTAFAQKTQVFPLPQDYYGLWEHGTAIPGWVLLEVRDIALSISLNLLFAATLLIRRLAESLVLTWLRKAGVPEQDLRRNDNEWMSLGQLLPILEAKIPAIYYKMEPCSVLAQAYGGNVAHPDPNQPREEIDPKLLKKAFDHTVMAIKEYYVTLPEQEELKKHAAEAKNKRKSARPKP